MHKKNILSIANFKDVNGRNIDPSTLSSEDFMQYQLAHLMNNVIKILEMAVPQERNFTAAKFEIMAKFHATYEQFLQKSEEA